MISFADGRSVFSVTSAGVGVGAATGADLSCVSSSRVCFSSASTRSVATATCWSGLFFGSTGSGDFARRFGVGVAAAVQVRLREDVGLRRLRDGLRVHQRDLERRTTVGEALQVERTEVDRQHDEVEEHRDADRRGEQPVLPRRHQRLARDGRRRQRAGRRDARGAPHRSLPRGRHDRRHFGVDDQRLGNVRRRRLLPRGGRVLSRRAPWRRGRGATPCGASCAGPSAAGFGGVARRGTEAWSRNRFAGMRLDAIVCDRHAGVMGGRRAARDFRRRCCRRATRRTGSRTSRRAGRCARPPAGPRCRAPAAAGPRRARRAAAARAGRGCRG